MEPSLSLPQLSLGEELSLMGCSSIVDPQLTMMRGRNWAILAGAGKIYFPISRRQAAPRKALFVSLLKAATDDLAEREVYPSRARFRGRIRYQLGRIRPRPIWTRPIELSRLPISIHQYVMRRLTPSILQHFGLC